MNPKKVLHRIRQLLEEHHKPRQIAIGVAIGVFIGFSPLFGFHTLIAILVSLIVHKANRLAILAGTQVSLPFFAPAIYWAEYKIGKLLLNTDLFLIGDGLDLSNIELGLLAILLGSALLGLVCASMSYFITLYAAIKIKARKHPGAA